MKMRKINKKWLTSIAVILLLGTIFIPTANSLDEFVTTESEWQNDSNKMIVQDNPSLSEEVKGALDWLINEAIITEDGIKWPGSDADSEAYTDLYNGVPGVCLLFSKAYEITGNETYLYYASGGINWLISIAMEEDGYKWAYTEDSTDFYSGLYMGTAGIGFSFIDFYNILGNESYLQYAEGAAQWLISIGEIDHDSRVGTTCEWPVIQGTTSGSLDIIVGAAGTGLFFLKIYNITHNETYLEYAKYAGNWLIKKSLGLGRYCYWDIRPSIFRFFISSGFAHGTSGIGFFFAELYKASGETKYLDYAEGAARWIIRDSVYDLPSRGVKWRAVYGDDRLSAAFSFDTGWCYGPAGICKLFIDLYEITGNNRYLRYSEMGVNWLMNIAISENNGYKWPRYLVTRWGRGRSNTADVTICHGAAGIGELFLEMYELTKKPVYLEYVSGAAEWLKQVAVKNGNGVCKWETYGQCYTGHHVGASGIALFLMKEDLI